MFNWCWFCVGKQKNLRLLPISMLENDRSEVIKMEEYRGCTSFCTGVFCQGTRTMLCIACKRMVYVHELNRTKLRHRKVREIACPGQVQYVELRSEKLFVGYPSSFAIYNIQSDGPATSRQSFYFWSWYLLCL